MAVYLKPSESRKGDAQLHAIKAIATYAGRSSGLNLNAAWKR